MKKQMLLTATGIMLGLAGVGALIVRGVQAPSAARQSLLAGVKRVQAMSYSSRDATNVKEAISFIKSHPCVECDKALGDALAMFNPSGETRPAKDEVELAVVARVVSRMAHGSPRLREASVSYLGGMSQVSPGLSAPDRASLGRIARSLGRMAPLHPAPLSIREGSRGLQAQLLLDSLREAGESRALPAARSIVHSDVPLAALAAVSYLGRFGVEADIPALESARETLNASEGSEQMRTAVAEAVTEIRSRPSATSDQTSK